MLASTTQLNTPGIALAEIDEVHALTDVTGFGLLGHLLEICRGSGVSAAIDVARIPLHEGVRALAEAGLVTGASARNWAGYGDEVKSERAAGALDDATRALLTDPQTSGGLLVACAPGATDRVLDILRAEGFDRAAMIGVVTEDLPARVTVR